MKIFDFSATNNMINLEKPSELGGTHMSENDRLRACIREKGVKDQNIMEHCLPLSIYNLTLSRIIPAPHDARYIKGLK